MKYAHTSTDYKGLELATVYGVYNEEMYNASYMVDDHEDEDGIWEYQLLVGFKNYPTCGVDLNVIDSNIEIIERLKKEQEHENTNPCRIDLLEMYSFGRVSIS